MADARRFFELLNPDWVEQIHLTALHVFEEVETAGVSGAGSQARYQMMALKKVRDYQRLLVYSLEGVEKYVDEMADNYPQCGEPVGPAGPRRRPGLGAATAGGAGER